MHGALSTLVAASAAAATMRTRTPSKTWQTLRLYHINPLRFDADDIADKDLGDAAGDAPQRHHRQAHQPRCIRDAAL